MFEVSIFNRVEDYWKLGTSISQKLLTDSDGDRHSSPFGLYYLRLKSSAPYGSRKLQKTLRKEKRVDAQIEEGDAHQDQRASPINSSIDSSFLPLFYLPEEGTRVAVLIVGEFRIKAEVASLRDGQRKDNAAISRKTVYSQLRSNE